MKPVAGLMCSNTTISYYKIRLYTAKHLIAIHSNITITKCLDHWKLMGSLSEDPPYVLTLHWLTVEQVVGSLQMLSSELFLLHS